MTTEAELVRRAEEAARAGRPFAHWWLDTVCRDRRLIGPFLNPQTHDKCLAAYNAIRPPVARAGT